MHGYFVQPRVDLFDGSRVEDDVVVELGLACLGTGQSSLFLLPFFLLNMNYSRRRNSAAKNSNFLKLYLGG